MTRKRKEQLGLVPSYISKIVYIGQYGDDKLRIFCNIKYEDGKLSITGVESPMKNGDCRGSCGQILDSIRENLHVIDYADGWDDVQALRFYNAWSRWHLNDMRAGTPEQEAFIEKWQNTVNRYEFGAACEALKAAGLYEVDGYRYGSKWLREDVPDDVLKFLESLPESKIAPAWI